MNKYEVKSTTFYDKPIIGIKVTPSVFGSSFVDEGVIHFSKPSVWRDEEKCGGNQYDPLEGAVLRTNNDYEVENIVSTNKQYLIKKQGDSTLIIDNDSKVFGCCFYTINQSDFKGPIKTNYETIQYGHTVNKEYFKKLYPNITKEEHERLPLEKRLSTILIFDFWKLCSLIKEKLIENGCEESAIHMSTVLYSNKKCSFFVNTHHPDEYFVKDDTFREQKEFRIIINSKNQDFNKWFEENEFNLKIGDISNLCSKQGFYFGDLEMAVENNKLLFQLSDPIISDVKNESFNQIIAILCQVKANGLPQGKLSEEETNIIISSLEKILLEKHGVIYDRDMNALYNLTEEMERDLKKLFEI